MDDTIELWDIKPYERWCLQEDIDALLHRLLSSETNLTKDVLTMYPILKDIDGEPHFVEGASLHVIRTTQSVRRIKTLSKRSFKTSIITYHAFMNALYLLVENQLHKLPFLSNGRIDVANFSEQQLQRLLYTILK